MQPIFKEMIQMWNDLGYLLPIEEGKYWLENHFVCGFTADGELHKLYKYKVADDLSIEITPYKPNEIKLLLLFQYKYDVVYNNICKPTAVCHLYSQRCYYKTP